MDRTEGPSNMSSGEGPSSSTSTGVGPGYVSSESTESPPPASPSETPLQPGNTAGPGGEIP